MAALFIFSIIMIIMAAALEKEVDYYSTQLQRAMDVIYQLRHIIEEMEGENADFYKKIDVDEYIECILDGRDE